MSQIPHAVQGYPRLATRMGLYPEFAIFKRFGDLSTRNLLYLQAELTYLSADLLDLEKEDDEDKAIKGIRYAQDWYKLGNSHSEEDNQNGQWDLVLKMRAKVTEYEEALIRASTIASMPSPNNSDLSAVQAYLYGSEMRLPFRGIDKDIYGSLVKPKDHAPDLIALRSRQSEDPFSRLISNTLIHPFFRCIGYKFKKKDPVLGEYAYNDEHMLQFARFVGTFINSVVLIASINALYFISSMTARLGAISGFNIVFALCLLIFAKARPIEVFATTSAFTAVQVVFITTGAGYGSPGPKA